MIQRENNALIHALRFNWSLWNSHFWWNMAIVATEQMTLVDAVERYLYILDHQGEIPYDARQILKRESLIDVRAAHEREKVSHEES